MTLATIAQAAELLNVSPRLIAKLIEEADASKKSRWRWGKELVELTPTSSTKRTIRINLSAVCPSLPDQATCVAPLDS